jgi:hypothetical protein
VNSKKSLRKNSDKNCWKYIIYWLEREKKSMEPWSTHQRSQARGYNAIDQGAIDQGTMLFFPTRSCRAGKFLAP